MILARSLEKGRSDPAKEHHTFSNNISKSV
jgi:hypothetical protein